MTKMTKKELALKIQEYVKVTNNQKMYFQRYFGQDKTVSQMTNQLSKEDLYRILTNLLEGTEA